MYIIAENHDLKSLISELCILYACQLKKMQIFRTQFARESFERKGTGLRVSSNIFPEKWS